MITTTTTVPHSVGSQPPAYTESAIESLFGGSISVKTDATAPAELRAIFDHVRAKHRSGDRWEVRIGCAHGPNDLASGKIANTSRGRELTGLPASEDVMFSTTGLTC